MNDLCSSSRGLQFAKQNANACQYVPWGREDAVSIFCAKNYSLMVIRIPIDGPLSVPRGDVLNGEARPPAHSIPEWLADPSGETSAC